MTPTPRLVQISSWSYSRFTVYEQCPYKAKLQILEKRREPSNEAMGKGSRVHAIAEAVTSQKLPLLSSENASFIPELKKILASNRIPTELECFEKEFMAMQKAGAITEDEWAFDRDWNYLGPKGWFDARAWLRIKVDAHYLTEKKLKGGRRETTVHIVDHKTGKISEDHALQRSLYALGAFLVYPDAALVWAAHWYLDPGEERKDVWKADQLEALKKEWVRKTKALLSDTTFAPRPNDKCRWCHFRAANGGPCVY